MDWTPYISSGIVAASVIFSAGGFYAISRNDNMRMKNDIGDIKADLKTLNKVVMDVALQNQRLDNQAERIGSIEKRLDERMGSMERRWDEVRRGEGLIKERVGANAGGTR